MTHRLTGDLAHIIFRITSNPDLTPEIIRHHDAFFFNFTGVRYVLVRSKELVGKELRLYLYHKFEGGLRQLVEAVTQNRIPETDFALYLAENSVDQDIYSGLWDFLEKRHVTLNPQTAER